MQTDCSRQPFLFQGLGSRVVVGAFDGGMITSDAGALLLRELEGKRRVIRRFASCFTDHRNKDAVEFSLEHLLTQRIIGIALGYEDLNDHDQLRNDPLLATVVGVTDPLGQSRRRASDRGKALAGKSTLNRLELHTGEAARDGVYKKIEVHEDRVDAFFVDVFLQAHRSIPRRVWLDLDATDDRIHGHQEGRFYHGYYRDYCYLPLYIFSGDFLLLAKLRSSNIDASAGSVEHVARIVNQLRRRWPGVEIAIRGDSGFCRDELMTWCESQKDVYFLLGLAQNRRLLGHIPRQMERAKIRHEITGKAQREFAEFRYQTLESWTRERRVIGKAEHLEKGANPRFVVTNLPYVDEDDTGQIVINDARRIYEDLYCARGEMENRIKETQLDLFSDRTSATLMKANQLRLWLSSVAYVVMNELRRVALGGTDLEQAQCGTIRLKVLKIGARIKVSARRVAISFSSAYPMQALFAHIHRVLSELEPLRC